MSMLQKVNEIITNNKVVVFSKSTCPFCKKVKHLFGSMGIGFLSVELDSLSEGPSIQSSLEEKTGQKTVPNVFIRGNHIGGCDSVHKIYEDGNLMALLNEGPSKYNYDLIVIGGGSGGLSASKEAALYGKNVAVCDFVVPTPMGTSWGLGGTCVNVGCIPKKLMHKAAIIGADMGDASYYGWEMPQHVNHKWETLRESVQNYIKSLNFGYRKLLREKKVTYLNAFAKFINQNTIEVTDKKGSRLVTADKFIIAVGGRPKYPDIPGAKDYGITSDDLFSLPHNPGKTLLVGASYIALECAGFLSGIGVDVTVMVRSILLRGFDQQIAKLIGEHMESHGIKFIYESVPTKLELVQEGKPGLIKVTSRKAGGEMTDEFNTVIFAIGREACTETLQLHNVGVVLNPNNNKIVGMVDEQSTANNIYAVGDVLDEKPELTPVAIQAGKLLAQRLYGNKNDLTDYDFIPTTVFTPLEYGCVGFSEEAAIKKYGESDIEVYHTFHQPLEFSLSGRDSMKSYCKLVCVKSLNNKVVGFHVLGPNAGEITQGFALAIKLGATKSDFSNLIGIHPTCAEVFTTLNITKSSGLSVMKTGC